MVEPRKDLLETQYENNSSLAVEEIDIKINQKEHYFSNDFYQIYLFTEGKGYHTIDFQTTPINALSVNFVYPSQLQSIEFTEQLKGYIIKFNKEFLLNNNEIEFGFFSIESYSIHHIQLSSEERFLEILDIIGEIKKEIVRQNAYSKEVISLYLKILMYKLKIVVEKNIKTITDGNHTFMIVDHFKKLVEENHKQLNAIGDYATLLNLTPTELNQLCKKYLNKSASRFIKDRIITAAKRFLIHTENSAKEIAYELNFSDPSNFTKFFKNYTKLTPAEYKKKVRDNNAFIESGEEN